MKKRIWSVSNCMSIDLIFPTIIKTNGSIWVVTWNITISWMLHHWKKPCEHVSNLSRIILWLIQVIKLKKKPHWRWSIASKLSLPAIAFQSMMNHCDESLPLIVSFAKETNKFKHGEQVRQLFHQSIIGGITNVFHRYKVHDTRASWYHALIKT